MRKIGVGHLTHITGNVQKKDENNEIKSNFYTYLIETTEKYDEKDNYIKIIYASPAFWKDEAAKFLKTSKIKPKVVFATCSSVDKRAFNEVMKRPEVMQALHDDRTTKEINLVEDLLVEVSKDGLGVYGFKETVAAVGSGAIKHLLVTDGLIKKMRDDGNYEKLDRLMKTSDSMKADITIVDSKNDGGKKLDGLSGVGGLLRYKV